MYSDLFAVRLEEAKQRLYDFICVDAAPMSRPNLEKVEFERICSTLPMRKKVVEKKSGGDDCFTDTATAAHSYGLESARSIRNSSATTSADGTLAQPATSAKIAVATIESTTCL